MPSKFRCRRVLEQDTEHQNRCRSSVFGACAHLRVIGSLLVFTAVVTVLLYTVVFPVFICFFTSILISPFLFVSPSTQLASPPAGAQSDQTDSLSGLREARQKCPLWLQYDEEGPGGITRPCESRLHVVHTLDCAHCPSVQTGVTFQFAVIYIAPNVVITCRGFTEARSPSLQAGRNSLLARGSRWVCKAG